MQTFYPNSDISASARIYPPSGNDFLENPYVDKTNTSLRAILAKNVRKRMEQDPSIRRQEMLEEKSGLGQSTVSRVLNCGGAATLDTLQALARAVGCQPWELLVDDDQVREDIVNRFLKRA
jgi:DNA-binding Xre family transcriptional regulator